MRVLNYEKMLLQVYIFTVVLLWVLMKSIGASKSEVIICTHGCPNKVKICLKTIFLRDDIKQDFFMSFDRVDYFDLFLWE